MEIITQQGIPNPCKAKLNTVFHSNLHHNNGNQQAVHKKEITLLKSEAVEEMCDVIAFGILK